MKRAALILLLWVALFGLAFTYRYELYFFLITPSKNFELTEAPPPPNYESLQFWAMHPRKVNDLNEKSMGTTQVFFLHPTSLKSRFAWNETLGTKASSEDFHWAWEHQASVFADCCQIFAPHYRQATLAAFWSQEEGFKARDLAYTDVLKAFDEFTRRDNESKPFILAGHSQGSEHGIRLIRDRILGTPLQKKMIAAYLIGIPMTRSALQATHPDLRICEQATDIGCLITWSSFAGNLSDKEFENFKDKITWLFPDGRKPIETNDFVCVNPLTWNADSTRINSQKHLGTFLKNGKKLFPSARCEQNVLKVDDIDHEISIKPDHNYHLYDYNLFYYNIQQNVEERIQSYKDTQ